MEILSEYNRILIASLQKSSRNTTETSWKSAAKVAQGANNWAQMGKPNTNPTTKCKGAQPHRFPQDLTRSFSSPWPQVGPCYQKGPLPGTRVLISLDIGLISPKSILKSSNSSQTQDSRLNSMNLSDAKQRFGLIWDIYWPLCHPASRFRLLNEAFCQLLEDYSLVNQLSEVVEGCHQIGRFEQQQLGLNQELIIIILYII